jgi:uncharacterized protein (DUF2147 family)
MRNWHIAPVIKALNAIIFIATGASAMAQMTPEGLWRNIDDKTGEAKAEIRIVNHDGVLSGRIEKTLTKNGEPTCTQCSDDRKDQPKLGMEIIRGAKKTEGKDVWEGGKILDPENGKEYTLRLTPIEDGKKLEVRGSILFIGRTQTWVRIQ